ncbi:hypothetical protein BG006_008007 [Podila minutissima]|uniref:Uncharacterized protein n=1 Tax=Podila minutissima TaxID=64525 RepID=A0A9P5SKQ2_9FUNG|nr:hypothetical protein BG006_008007 [Podila minutissima]
MTNPLELYEVIQRVGYFIQIHKQREDHRYWHFDFRPKDLISCLQINKTWRQALTPLLWRVYNEEEMMKLEVPPELYQANSQYFWYLELHSPWPADTLKPTQLRQLVIRGQALKASLGLLQSNRLLSLLDVSLYDNTSYSDVQKSFDYVTWLKILRFHSGASLDPDHFASFIFNNRELTELLVSSIDGFETLEQHEPMMHLTTLQLDVLLGNNPGLVQLIRFCPNLEVFWFEGYADCPFEAVATNLRECCPKVSSIRCLNTFSIISPDEVLWDNELIALINSSRRLTHFEMPIFDLTPRSTLALLTPHWSTLQLLRLDLHGFNGKDNLVNAGNILACCINLHKFVLHNENRNWLPADCLGLLRRPWLCKRLSAFTMTGIWFEAQADVDDSAEPFEKDPDDPNDVEPTMVVSQGFLGMASSTDLAHSTKNLADLSEFVPKKMLGRNGWEVHDKSPVDISEALSSKCGNRLVREILERTISLANIRKVTVNGYLYAKAGSPELRRAKALRKEQE